MRKLGDDINRAVLALGGDSDEARINMRIRQVRDRYRQSIEAVYQPETARYHLMHTNNVIIRKKDGVKTLTVYVDDSACAADLNGQRELIALKLLELCGEEIDRFEIRISRWKKYRENHPYAEQITEKTVKPSFSVPLSAEDESYVSATVGRVEDEKVRKALKEAMTADLKWKREEKVENLGKNRK